MLSLTLLLLVGACAAILLGVIVAVLVVYVQSRDTGRETEPLPERPLSYAGLERQISELLASGNKIEAIKVYRKATGAGLKEAKDAVEAFKRGAAPAYPPGGTQDLPQDLEEEVRWLLREGQKIEAIKRYRETTGLGLKVTKEAVDAIARGQQ